MVTGNVMVDLSEGACPSHSLQKDPPTIVPTLHMPIIGAIKNRLHCPPPPSILYQLSLGL